MFQSRKLDDLDSRLKPIACELIARCAEALIPVMIIGTLRDLEQQKHNIAIKVSWTLNSLHLPQSPESKSLAIDICPYLIYDAKGPDKLNWPETDPSWQVIGKIGERLGLKWGVVNSQGQRKDLGHFEYRLKENYVTRSMD